MKKILIINRLGIGDVVLTTPLAEAIKKQLSARVGFLVSPKAVDVITNHPYIDDVFAYKYPSKKAMIAKLRAMNYDGALIVDERLTSTLLALKAGCRPLNMGLEVSLGKRRLFSGKLHAERAVMHYTNYLKYLGKNVQVPELATRVGAVDAESKEKINQWLYTKKLAAGKLIIIVAKGLSENKNWLPEYFGEINTYFNKLGIKPVYLGAKNDAEYIDAISGDKINAAGDFTLREVAALAEHAALCISLCTGTMHIIATTNVPIIALYGPTNPKRWAPSQACVLQADLDCIPCESLVCKNAVYKQCMKDIKPQNVIDSIETNS